MGWFKRAEAWLEGILENWEKYQEEKPTMPRTKDDFFVSENHILEDDEAHLSPSGKYKLTIQTYNTSKTSGKCSWEYTAGIVTEAATGEKIAEVRRNYSRFWYLWLVQDEKEYLLCGENYQGYGVVDPQAGTTAFYLPNAAEKGNGFCFSEVKQTAPDQILVNGCYWGGPYEVVLFDVSDPLTLPYPELDRRDNAGDQDPDFSDRAASEADEEHGESNRLFHLEQDQLCFGGALELAKHYFRKILDGDHVAECMEWQKKQGFKATRIHCNCALVFADFGLRGSVMMAREMTLLDLKGEREHDYLHPPYEASEGYEDQSRGFPIPEQKELDDELIREEMRGRRGEHRLKWSSNQ